jgi:two-component system NarL family sensor kinase
MTHLTADDSRTGDPATPGRRHWVVLADTRRPDSPDEPTPLRRMVIVTAIAAVAVAALVGLVGSLLARHTAENEAVHNVAQLTDVLARSVVQPALTDAMATSPKRATAVLDPIVRQDVVDQSLVRIKLWNSDGTVLYSNDPRLVGQRFPLDPDARHALTSPHTEAEISDLQRPENRLDRGQGKLLEVYRPVWTPNRTALLFETYFKYDSVVARSHQLWRGFAGIILTSIGALMLLLVPLVWALVNRTRRARADRDRAAAWALAASDEERRHIAATLHDGVVQQLAATSFAAAGEAHRAASSGDGELGDRLSALASGVRDAIAGLRSLLVDIYPPSLHSSGVTAALRDLARSSTGSGATVDVEIDADVADALPSDAQESTFRVVQEALRNAVRHSQADRVTIAVAADASGAPVVRVDDDGRGFDLADTPARDASGHFGLRLMADAAVASGARLEVASGAGDGTHLRMSWPQS